MMGPNQCLNIEESGASSYTFYGNPYCEWTTLQTM